MRTAKKKSTSWEPEQRNTLLKLRAGVDDTHPMASWIDVLLARDDLSPDDREVAATHLLLVAETNLPLVFRTGAWGERLAEDAVRRCKEIAQLLMLGDRAAQHHQWRSPVEAAAAVVAFTGDVSGETAMTKPLLWGPSGIPMPEDTMFPPPERRVLHADRLCLPTDNVAAACQADLQALEADARQRQVKLEAVSVETHNEVSDATTAFVAAAAEDEPVTREMQRLMSAHRADTIASVHVYDCEMLILAASNLTGEDPYDAAAFAALAESLSYLWIDQLSFEAARLTNEYDAPSEAMLLWQAASLVTRMARASTFDGDEGMLATLTGHG